MISNQTTNTDDQLLISQVDDLKKDVSELRAKLADSKRNVGYLERILRESEEAEQTDDESKQLEGLLDNMS